MNPAFSALLDEKIEFFKHAFSATSRQAFVDPDTGKLFHPAEFGTYRETILKNFVTTCIPARLDIGTGFLINASGGISTQADIVIYDRTAIPRIESSEHQRFFPVEGVCAIGEVKSVLNKVQLREALNKLARSKKIADILSSEIPIYRDKQVEVQKFNRVNIPYDQIFSFLVCEYFSFNPKELASDVSSWYDADIQIHHRHNLVLSIKDGLLLYVDMNGKSWMYPANSLGKVRNRFVSPVEIPNLHFYMFCNYMHIATSSATLLYPEMSAYMPPLGRGHVQDEA